MELILPERVRTEIEVRKAREDKLKNKSYGVGMSPWKNNYNASSARVRRQPPKTGTWDDYYMMYTRHALVRAAIDMKSHSATATSFRYISRDGRNIVKKREVSRLAEFFDAQPNLLGELFEVYRDLLICGDAYMYIIADRAKKPRKLKRIPPKTIIVEADRSGTPTAYYQINPNNPVDNDYVRFEPHEILHFMIPDPDNDLYGLSPLESLRWAVNTDLYAQRYNAAFFKNSGMTGTIIAIKSSNTGEIDRNKRWLEQHYFGPDAAHTPIVLEGDMDIQVHKAVKSQNEMDFLAGRSFIRSEILAVLSVPPSKLGFEESSNRATAKEQSATFRNESVRALQLIVETVLNDQLIYQVLGIENTIIRHSEADMSDRIELMEYYTKGEAFGIFSPNEVRQDLGKPPIDGGDVHFLNTPTGSIPLDRMNLYFQLPRTNTDTVPPVPSDPVEGEPLPKERTSSQQATASVTKAAEAIKDIDFYMLSNQDGALLSAYVNAKAYSTECGLTIQKAIYSTDELERRGLIFQALQQLQAGVTTHEE